VAKKLIEISSCFTGGLNFPKKYTFSFLCRYSHPLALVLTCFTYPTGLQIPETCFLKCGSNLPGHTDPFAQSKRQAGFGIGLILVDRGQLAGMAGGKGKPRFDDAIKNIGKLMCVSEK